MILREVYARFYKSFNYDFLRKNHESSKELPWERVEGKWYLCIGVPIEKDITTLVGSNESGKNHLLTAIEKGISGKNVRIVLFALLSPQPEPCRERQRRA
jgi:hypothetical protein